MKGHSVLMLSYCFPPMAAVGGHRTIRFLKYLPEFGWRALVLAPSRRSLDPAQLDPTLESLIPAGTVVARARVFRPATAAEDAVRAVRSWWQGPATLAAGAQNTSAADLSGNEPDMRRSWLRRTVRRALALAFEVPDEYIGWLFPAVKTGLSLIRTHRPRVLYSSGPPHSTHLIALVLKQLSGLPLVIDLRDPWSRTDWKPRHDGFPRLQRGLEELCVRRSDRVILNTARLCDDFRQCYGKTHHHKFLAIPNGCDPDLSRLAAELLVRNAPSCTDPSIRICHPGSVYGERNLRSVAVAIRHLAEAGHRVTFEQIGVVEQSDALLRYLRENRLGASFQLRGRLSHAETLRRMAAANVLLLLQPGTTIQVPAKLFEMLPFRKPIVAVAGEGATADIIKLYDLGLIADPNDGQGIAEAILRAANDRSRCNDGAWDRALAAFDGRRLAGELAQVLCGVL